MFSKFLKILAAIIIILIAVIYFQPSQFRVSRTALAPAAVSEVFVQVNDLRNWETWSPWSDLDPDMKKTYTGPRSGAGSVYQWSGNNKVGEGRVTITESRLNERIRMKLEFIKPFAAVNDVEFTFEPQGGETAVTWAMTGRNNFISKAVGMVMNCDTMLGGQFERGLARLKATVAGVRQKI